MSSYNLTEAKAGVEESLEKAYDIQSQVDELVLKLEDTLTALVLEDGEPMPTSEDEEPYDVEDDLLDTDE